MENYLESLINLNKVLNNEKQEIRKKLYERILSKFHKELIDYEKTLFEIASILFDDKEYEKLRLDFIRLNDLTNSIFYNTKNY